MWLNIHAQIIRAALVLGYCLDCIYISTKQKKTKMRMRYKLYFSYKNVGITDKIFLTRLKTITYLSYHMKMQVYIFLEYVKAILGTKLYLVEHNHSYIILSFK